MSTKTKSVDEIFDKLANYNTGNGEVSINIDEAKAALLKEILSLPELEDEKLDDSRHPQQFEYRNKLRNEARADIRKALKTYFGEKE